MAGMSHSLRGRRLSPSTHKAVYMWGRGTLGHALAALVRTARVDDRNDIAAALAAEHGCPVGLVAGAWAIAVTGSIDEGDLDALTRDDPAVLGWTADRNATCAPSVALRNALNALTPQERGRLAQRVAARFLSPDASPADAERGRMTASDGRHVVFDEALSQWRLGDYAVK
jgi:hypothetical protein